MKKSITLGLILNLQTGSFKKDTPVSKDNTSIDESVCNFSLLHYGITTVSRNILV